VYEVRLHRWSSSASCALQLKPRTTLPGTAFFFAYFLSFLHVEKLTFNAVVVP
jgi:hypothetical protein